MSEDSAKNFKCSIANKIENDSRRNFVHSTPYHYYYFLSRYGIYLHERKDFDCAFRYDTLLIFSVL